MNNIKLFYFKDVWIVSEFEEVSEFDEEIITEAGPDCLLKYPYTITENGLEEWPQYSDEREILVRSSDISVLVDPKNNILVSYLELVDKETQ